MVGGRELGGILGGGIVGDELIQDEELGGLLGGGMVGDGLIQEEEDEVPVADAAAAAQGSF